MQNNVRRTWEELTRMVRNATQSLFGLLESHSDLDEWQWKPCMHVFQFNWAEYNFIIIRYVLPTTPEFHKTVQLWNKKHYQIAASVFHCCNFKIKLLSVEYGGWFVPFRLFVISWRRWKNEAENTQFIVFSPRNNKITTKLCEITTSMRRLLALRNI